MSIMLVRLVLVGFCRHSACIEFVRSYGELLLVSLPKHEGGTQVKAVTYSAMQILERLDHNPLSSSSTSSFYTFLYPYLRLFASPSPTRSPLIEGYAHRLWHHVEAHAAHHECNGVGGGVGHGAGESKDTRLGRRGRFDQWDGERRGLGFMSDTLTLGLGL